MKRYFLMLICVLMTGIVFVNCSSDDKEEEQITELPTSLVPGTTIAWQGYYTPINDDIHYSEGSSYLENYFTILDTHYIKTSWSTLTGNFKYQYVDKSTAQLNFSVFQQVAGTQRHFKYDCTLKSIGNNEFEMTGTKMVEGKNGAYIYKLYCTCIITLP